MSFAGTDADGMRVKLDDRTLPLCCKGVSGEDLVWVAKVVLQRERDLARGSVGDRAGMQVTYLVSINGQ